MGITIFPDYLPYVKLINILKKHGYVRIRQHVWRKGDDTVVIEPYRHLVYSITCDKDELLDILDKYNVKYSYRVW